MRIISGKYRKKNIVPPKNFRARPTTDMAKESLFNIIENEFEVESLKVLDLFGGTGSISYEFVSRGCNDVTCVELNFNHYSFIKKMIRELKMDSQIQLIKTNVFSYLSKCGSTFDLIFADPPYDLEGIEILPDLIFNHNLLKPEGVFILEHSKNKSFETHTHFHLQKNYGSVNFSFFR